MNEQVRIVHEAASQRQHVRLRVPATAEIAGKTYDVDDWSVGGVKVRNYDRPAAAGDMLPIALHFQFGGFDMSLRGTIEVRHYDAGSGFLGGRFTDMTPERLALLHYLIDAYLSGEVVGAGDVLQIVQRDNSTKARGASLPPVNRSRGAAIAESLRRNVGLALILAAALALAIYIVANLYTRTFVVAGDGAITSPQGSVIRAPGAGVVIAFAVRPGEQVKPGSALATLERPDGQVTNISSNCVCIVGERLAQLGESLSKSAPILSLAPNGGTTRATLVVRLKEIRKVEVGDRVAVNFFNDNATAMGRVERVGLPGLTDPATLERNGLKVPDLAGSVTVRFDQPIGIARLGQPVSGRIRLYKYFPFW